MSNKTYSLTMVEGQVKLVNTRGNVVDIEIPENMEVIMRTAEQVKETAQTGIEVAVEATKTVKIHDYSKHAFQEIPEKLLGKYGVCSHKNSYYMVCCHCGSFTSLKQAEYSVDHWGRVICIDCQRQHRTNGKYFTSPEARFTKEVKYSRPCSNEKCVDKEAAAFGKKQRRMITGHHLSLSLALTDGQYGLCPHCLVKYALAKAPVAPVEQQKEEDAVPKF